MLDNLLLGVVTGLICGLITAVIGEAKGRRVGSSFAWGFFLGVLGPVIFAFLPRVETAPAGMRAVKCTRCNADQNIPSASDSFECWQCKTVIAAATT